MASVTHFEDTVATFIDLDLWNCQLRYAIIQIPFNDQVVFVITKLSNVDRHRIPHHVYVRSNYLLQIDPWPVAPLSGVRSDSKKRPARIFLIAFIWLPKQFQYFLLGVANHNIPSRLCSSSQMLAFERTYCTNKYQPKGNHRVAHRNLLHAGRKTGFSDSPE